MRRAFTLVELLVVVIIILLLLGIVLMFLPKRESMIAIEAAGQVETYLASAKARAMRDNQIIGVRLFSDDGNKTFNSMVMLDSGSVWAPFGGSNALNLPSGLTIQQSNQTPNPVVVGNTATQIGLPLQGNVEVGDMLEIVEVTPSIHRIESINYATNTMTLVASKEQMPDGSWFVHGVPNVSCVAQVQLKWNYRYHRRPRPLMGEQPITLHKEAYIAGFTGIVPTSLNVPVESSGFYEIWFSPGGVPINTNSRMVLWVADRNNVAKPTLLCIYPTGGIKSHSVGPSGQEFQFTQDGR